MTHHLRNLVDKTTETQMKAVAEQGNDSFMFAIAYKVGEGMASPFMLLTRSLGNLLDTLGGEEH